MTILAPLPTRTQLAPLASGDFGNVAPFYRQHRINGLFLTALTWPALPKFDNTDVAEIGSGMTGLSGATPLSGGLSIQLSPAGATLTVGSALGLSGQQALSSYDYRLLAWGQSPIEQRHCMTPVQYIVPAAQIDSQQHCHHGYLAIWAQPLHLSAAIPSPIITGLHLTTLTITPLEIGSPLVLSDQNALSDYAHTLDF